MKKILFIPVICMLCAACNGNSNNPNVTNQMQSQQSDLNITATVKKNLMTDNSLSASARIISVATNNGVVTLTGTVISNEENLKVVNMVQNVPGVTSVDNQLTIASP